jgi:tetratricopeptide (TPR) repeat protein
VTVDEPPVAHAPGSPKQDTAPVAALSTQRGGPKGRAFYRTVAQQIAEAADALEHAHQLGIVHRDVKPGNLIVDTAGKVWVADFGLARFGPDAGLTMSGDLLGTLRYMAPEQVLSHHGLVDHRADVYALGATLYELLTGRPAVGGTERADILRTIAFEDPTPLRKLERTIPAELETITLKCLAKNPAERYATAGELAEDLRRWLGHQTIKAKPPTLRQRAAKWGLRHKALVRSMLAALLVAVFALAASMTWVWRKEQETRTAFDTATAQRARAETNLRRALDALNHIYLQAIDRRYPTAGSDLITPLYGRQVIDDADRKLLEDVLAFYEQFARENAEGPEARYELAKATKLISDIRWRLNLVDGAWHTTYDRGIDLLRELAGQFPDNPLYRFELARHLIDRYDYALERVQEAVAIRTRLVEEFPREFKYRVFLIGSYGPLAASLSRRGRGGEADAVMRTYFEQVERLARDFPDEPGTWNCLAAAHATRARRLRGRAQSAGSEAEKGRITAEAEKACRAALAIRQRQADQNPNDNGHLAALAGSLAALGTTLDLGNRSPEAESYFRQVVDCRRRLSDRQPNNSVYQHQLVVSLWDLAAVRQKMPPPQDVIPVYRQALDVLEPVAARSPGRADCQNDLGNTLHKLAQVHVRRGEPAEARRLLDRAIGHQRRAVGALPQQPDLTQQREKDAYLQSLLSHYQSLIDVLWSAGQWADAEPVLRQCAENLERLAGEQPDNLNYRGRLHNCLLGLADVLHRLGRPADARLVLEQDRRNLTAVLHQARTRPPDKGKANVALIWRLYADLLMRLGPEVVSDGEIRDAVRELERCIDTPVDRNNVAWLLATCRDPRFRDPRRAVELSRAAVAEQPANRTFLNSLGAAEYRAGNVPGAVAALEQSMRLGNGGDSFDWFFLAMAHRQLGDLPRSFLYYLAAVRWMDTTGPHDDELRRFRSEAAELLGIPNTIKTPDGPRPDP